MNISVMIEDLKQFLFKDENNDNTVEISNNKFLVGGPFHSNGSLDYKTFKAIHKICSAQCDIPDINNLKKLEVVGDYLRIDTRKIHMIMDRLNSVVLVGYDDKNQSENSIIGKLYSTIDQDCEVFDQNVFLNDGYYKLIYIPERLMFNGIKDQHDIKMFLKIVYLYMWKIRVEMSNIMSVEGEIPYCEIAESTSYKFISIIIYFLYYYRNEYVKSKEEEIIDLVVTYGIKSFFTGYHLICGIDLKKEFSILSKIYEREGPDTFLESLIYGSLGVLNV